MKLYLAGPMTGYPDHNRPLFKQKAAELRAAGYEVVDASECNGTYEEALAKSYLDCLKTDLREMLTCQGIAVLPGWMRSKGASIECNLAAELNMPMDTVAGWIARRNAA